MAESLSDVIMRMFEQAAGNYHRLLIVVAPAGAGKTSALQEVHKRTGAPLLNINLDLSRQLLDLTGRQRAISLPRLLGEIIGGIEGEMVLLDNIEMLFDVSLMQDPLRLLQNLSRNKTLVVAWSGIIDKGHLVYATPDHPEYKRYPIRDFLTANTEVTA